MNEDERNAWAPPATIAEAAEEYHLRGEPCPWDCWRCDPDNPRNMSEEDWAEVYGGGEAIPEVPVDSALLADPWESSTGDPPF